MEIAFTEWVPVTDASSVGEVRRTALSAAQRLGFDETRSGELALLATEASRNILVHGGGGQVVLTGINQPGGPMARILALDSGAGIPNLAEAMADGYSTSGTMGGGLGAMKRIASGLEIFSGKTGTIVMLELGRASYSEAIRVAGIAVPYPGERVCGDEWSCHSTSERAIAILVDGLGHGWGAAEAAKEAIATFRERTDLAPGQILDYIHDALRSTRGAVAAIAEVRSKERVLIFAGHQLVYSAMFTFRICGRLAGIVSLQRNTGGTHLEDPGVPSGLAGRWSIDSALGRTPVEVGSNFLSRTYLTSSSSDRRGASA